MESNLLENSLIHLLDAVNRLNEEIPDIISLKYAVVHLWRGIKILLEKRLVDEHWTLIYGNNIYNSKYLNNNFNPGGFASLNFNDLKYRLDKFCGINIDEYNYILNKFRKDYHNIENSRFKGSKIQITGSFTEVWPFIVGFVSKNIDFSHDPYAKNMFNQTCKIMDSHLKFIRQKKNEIKTFLSNQLEESFCAKPLKCPKCLQDAIPLLSNNNGKYRCAFCDHVILWNKLAVEFGSYFSHIGPFDCLDCSFQGTLKFDDKWICLSCSNVWDIEHINICNLCGEKLFWAQHDRQCCKHCKCTIT